ncbi:hypothetical protein QFZ41_000502 [Luteibacter sp. W1I16]
MNEDHGYVGQRGFAHVVAHVFRGPFVGRSDVPFEVPCSQQGQGGVRVQEEVPFGGHAQAAVRERSDQDPRVGLAVLRDLPSPAIVMAVVEGEDEGWPFRALLRVRQERLLEILRAEHDAPARAVVFLESDRDRASGEALVQCPDGRHEATRREVGRERRRAVGVIGDALQRGENVRRHVVSVIQRFHAGDHRAADGTWIQPHHRQRPLRAEAPAEQADFFIAECTAQVVDVGGECPDVVAGEVLAGIGGDGGPGIGPHGGDIGAHGGGAVVGKGLRWNRQHVATGGVTALLHDHQVAHLAEGQP